MGQDGQEVGWQGEVTDEAAGAAAGEAMTCRREVAPSGPRTAACSVFF